MDFFTISHPPVPPKLFQAHKTYHSSLTKHLITSKSLPYNKQIVSLTPSQVLFAALPSPCNHHKCGMSSSVSSHPARFWSTLFRPILQLNNRRCSALGSFSKISSLKLRCSMQKSSENGRPTTLTSSSSPPPSSLVRPVVVSSSPLSSSSSAPPKPSPLPPPSPPPPPPSSPSSSSSSSPSLSSSSSFSPSLPRTPSSFSPSTSSSSSSISSPGLSPASETALAKVLLASEEQEAALSHLLASKNLIEFITRVPTWADAQKESGMPQRQQRAFYSHQDWLHHRSSLRHMRHMLSSGSSRVILSLIPPVFVVTAISVVIATYNTSVNLGLLPPIFHLLHAASLPYELTAPAIALLLVFRTDASYSRYDEARKTWTKIMSTTEDFVRKSVQLIHHPEDLALKSSLLAYIMAFPVSLKCHLMYGSDERKDLQNLLGDDDLAFVLASRHHPNCLIRLMSQTLCLLQLEYSEKAHLDDNISQFTASINVCERLIRTPIPLSYTRLTSRFLVLWHLTLPIILWDSCDWFVVPATFFNAATLFCIEEVGVIIEEPFPMLALDKMIGLAHDNIWEMLKLHQITKEHLCRLKINNKSSFKSHG